MNKSEEKTIIQKYLVNTYGCEFGDLIKEGVSFSINATIEKPHIKILAYEKSIIVNASTDIYTLVEKMLLGKTRDEIFECPLVYGQTIHYVPDLDFVSEPNLLEGYSYELLQGEELSKLSYIHGFDNSLTFDEQGRTTAKIAFVARKNDTVVGIAGAGAAMEDVWEVGIDVNPICRKQGLGSILTRRLTWEILEKGFLPFYSASVTNIASQRVASRAGYIPCWIDTFGTVYDKNYAYSCENVMEITKTLQPMINLQITEYGKQKTISLIE